MRIKSQVRVPDIDRAGRQEKSIDLEAWQKNVLLGALALLAAGSIFMLRFSYTPTAAGSHALGIVGAFLMIQTELTYTWRKKKYFSFGSARRWLQLHIATGLLGPALILWHADFSLSGFAGLVTYLTILVTISGIFGRYIYRLIPRTLQGEERGLQDMTREQRQFERELRVVLAKEPATLELILGLDILAPKGRGLIGVARTALDYRRARRAIHRHVTALGRHQFAAYKQLEALAVKRLALERRVVLLANSKRALANWNKFHKPLTLTLFYAIGIHVMTIIYYGKSL